MKISPALVYANIFSLLMNGVFLMLAVFKLCSFLVSAAVFVVCLGVLVWLSCRINGIPPKKFRAAKTEKVKGVRV